MAHERERRAGDAVRRRLLDRAEVRGEREERPGHRLHEPVSREELLLADPSGRDHRVVQQRQDDVAAAEDERARAEHRVDEREPLPSSPRSRSTGRPRSRAAKTARHATEPRLRPAKRRVRTGGRPSPRRTAMPATAPSAIAAACPPNPLHTSATTAPATASASRGASGASERRIAEHGEPDHGHRDELEPVHPPGAGDVGGRHGERERRHRDRGREREAEPRGEPAEPPRSPRPDGDPELARRRARQEVRDRDQLGELLLVEPAPADDVGVPEVADVRDWAAERRQAEPERDCKDLGGAAASVQPRVAPGFQSGSSCCARAFALRARMKSRSERRLR